MPKERVAVYFDGFNLYHAIADLNRPHLKWVNLRKLAQLLIKTKTQRVVAVHYFSAYAKHFGGTPKVGRLLRHREYVRALEAKGVKPQMGNFARRDWRFGATHYRARWTKYEEKQTDVGIAVNLIHDAHRDEFDRALVVSVDTDMLPAFAIMRAAFPAKTVVCVAPPRRSHHRDIQDTGVELAVIKESQIEKALFGPLVRSGGAIIARRPPEYRPPA